MPSAQLLVVLQAESSDLVLAWQLAVLVWQRLFRLQWLALLLEGGRAQRLRLLVSVLRPHGRYPSQSAAA
ncbi:hypothetical protein [Limnohabitans sp.]|uniref:hypothetical protein n=1 Tax=Limnohabitans sp. TaxID=1907725 RepID=UPI00286F2F30|nr:hypothetical protein [Limnohabitans sp.]